MKCRILNSSIIFVILIYLNIVLGVSVGDPIEHICGIRSTGAKTGLVFKGTALKRGELPWLAALLERKPKQLPSYFCGGALISDERVITAAHCMHPKGDTAKLEKELVIILGGFDVNDPYETGRQTALAKEIIIQSSYNSKDYNRFTGDLAMIVLTDKVQFSELVKPICLFSKGQADDYEGTSIVAGWGITEQFQTEGAATASFIEIPILSNEKCYREDPRLAGIGWDESFCAGKEGIGVCSGDSGSGIYVEMNGKYYLKGVVSAAINGGACGGNHLAIFTDTTKYDLSVDGRLKNLKSKDTETSEVVKPAKLIQCGRVPADMPSKLYGNKVLQLEDVPWFVEFTTDKYTVLGVFLAPDKIITSFQPKVSGAPLTIVVGGTYIDKKIKKVTNITNIDGDTTIGSIVTLSSPVKELEDLPCLLPDFYVPSANEEIFSFDETTDEEERRQISVGKNIDMKKCDTENTKENNRYCIQLTSSGVFPSFAFTIKDGKLSIIGVFRLIGSTLEKGQFYDLITFKAISSKNIPVKYP